jgi:hypothetical protein
MKLREFVIQINKMAEHIPEYNAPEVVVSVARAHRAVGAQHAVPVSPSGRGIDWDSGSFFLFPSERLYAGMAEMMSAARFANRVRELIYMLHREPKVRNANAACLNLIEEALDKWMPDRSEKKGKAKP